METSGNDQRLHVSLDYVEPGDHGEWQKIEFHTTQDQAHDHIHRVVEGVRMDHDYREQLLAKLDRSSKIHHGFLFIEPSPSRRVCLSIHYYNERMNGIVRSFDDFLKQRFA